MQIEQAEELLIAEVLTAFEQQPAGLLQRRVTPLAFHAGCPLRGPRRAPRHFGDDVEPVENAPLHLKTERVYLQSRRPTGGN
ncbi:MAG TPA: hypothetical protein VKB79_19750 [Bryobacteraceae bacterium]|nr:hypothetical protein [Bryobacteraceae bacterium]